MDNELLELFENVMVIDEDAFVPSYDKTIEAIIRLSKEIKLDLSSCDGNDGRLVSAIKEKPLLDILENLLVEEFPFIKITRPSARFWADIFINGIPINLKISSCKTDNAFNKSSIKNTCLQTEDSMGSCNFNRLYENLVEGLKPETRNLKTEYHYLVFDKKSGNVLCKSILDIKTYKSNPSNILQINWNKEFASADYRCDNHKEKIRELLKTIQKSLRDQYNNNKMFIEADIDKDFA